MQKSKIVKFFLKLFVSLAFVAWLIFKIDWQEVLFYISKISFWNILIYVAVLLFGMAISAYKWKILAKFKGFDISLKRSFQLYLAGTFINNLMPSFIGGDTYKAYQIGKDEKRYVSAAASVVVDRITGLIGAMILSVIFAALNWPVVSEHRILLIILAIVFLILILAVIIGASAKFSFWQKLFQFMPKKILEIIKDFAEYKNDEKTLIKSLLLSFAFGSCWNCCGKLCFVFRPWNPSWNPELSYCNISHQYCFFNSGQCKQYRHQGVGLCHILWFFRRSFSRGSGCRASQ